MGSIADGIQRLRDHKLTVRLEGDRLKVEPEDRITDVMDDWLQAHAEQAKEYLRWEQEQEMDRKSVLPRPNTTPVPDVFFDEIAPDLDNGELRVMLYLIRRTYGFKKHEDTISLSQFCAGIKHRNGVVVDRGTGLHHKSVIRALKLLVDRGLVEVVKGKSEQRGNDVNLYRLVIERTEG